MHFSHQSKMIQSIFCQANYHLTACEYYDISVSILVHLGDNVFDRIKIAKEIDNAKENLRFEKLEVRLTYLEKFNSFLDMLESGTWDNPTSLSSFINVNQVELPYELLIDSKVFYAGLTFGFYKEVELFTIYTIGKYFVATIINLRGSFPPSIIGVDKRKYTSNELYAYLKPTTDESLRPHLLFPLKPKSLLDLWEFTRKQLDQLPEPLSDGFIRLTDDNVKFLQNLAFVD